MTILTRLSLRLSELFGLRFDDASELRRLEVVAGLLRPLPLLLLLPFNMDVVRLLRGNVLLPSLTLILTLNMILFLLLYFSTRCFLGSAPDYEFAGGGRLIGDLLLLLI